MSKRGLVTMKRRGFPLALLTTWVGCGGGGGTVTPTTNPPAPQTLTFMGSANPSCQLGGHNFEAAEGPVSVTLVQTTGGLGLYGQVCAGGLDNNNCTINQTPMAVGQTLTGTRKGASSQNVKMLTLNCGTGPAPPGPVDYTISVVYLR
jgi:hypothetical protein